MKHGFVYKQTIAQPHSYLAHHIYLLYAPLVSFIAGGTNRKIQCQRKDSVETNDSYWYLKLETKYQLITMSVDEDVMEVQEEWV